MQEDGAVGPQAWLNLFSELDKTNGLGLDEVGKFIREKNLLFFGSNSEGEISILGSRGVMVQAMENGYVSLDEKNKQFRLTELGKQHITFLNEELRENPEAKPLYQRL